MLTTFDDQYVIKSKEYYCNQVLEKAKEISTASVLTKGILSFAYIMSEEVKNNIFSLALSLNEDGLYVYVLHAIIKKEDYNQNEVEKFCDDVVKKGLEFFNIKIWHVILDFNMVVEQNASIQIGEDVDVRYLRTHTFRTLLSELATNCTSIEVRPGDNEKLKKIESYNNCLDEFKQNFSVWSVGETMEEIFSKIKENILTVNENLLDIIDNHLDSFYVAALYLDPRFRLDSLEDPATENYHYLRQRITNFWKYGVPKKALAVAGQYARREACFTQTEEEEENCSPFEFWEIAQTEVDHLPAIALSLLKVRAVPKKFDLIDFHNILEVCEYDAGDFAYVISLFLQD